MLAMFTTKYSLISPQILPVVKLDKNFKDHIHVEIMGNVGCGATMLTHQLPMFMIHARNGAILEMEIVEVSVQEKIV